MNTIQTKFVIEICMGSSCYSRGNRLNAEFIQDYVEKNGLKDRVELVGRLCTGHCKCGPNVIFNGEVKKNVTPAVLPDLIRHYLGNP